MSVFHFPPKNSTDPVALLHNVIKAQGSEIEDLIVIVRTKDDQCEIYATNQDLAFLSVALLLLQDLSLKLLRQD